MLVTFEQNRMVQNCERFFFFFLITIFDKELKPFRKKFLQLKLLLNAKLLIQRLSSYIVPKTTALQHLLPG